MIRVVHCIYDDPRNPWVGGGGAVRLHEIYRRLAGQLDVTIVTGRFPGARDEDAEGFRSVRLGAASPYAWSRLTYGRAATRLLRTAAYDAAVFDFSAYTPIRIPADRPVGVMLGQMAGPTARVRWGRVPGAAVGGWERMQLRRARWVAAVSPWLLDEARPALRADAETTVIGAGVDERFFRVRRAERDFLLYYGRFDVFQKGIDVLLDAMAILVRDRPNLALKVAGRGKDAQRIAAMIAERGLQASVELIANPTHDDVHALMAGALAMVMPSRFEGFGMVAAEAMAAGIPVVAAGVDAVPDVVGEDGGVLVPREDAAATAAAIAALLDAPDRRAALSASARVRARRWSWDEVARDHLAWLNRISAGRTSPSPSGSR
ncbi:glycosyltransferase family 4 protein [Longimicrobium sp.]|uniref:glycosyltransferase family 4 protein n=1 Tax=Longimicrobium sp. TaxID=2029185 RepID=UPI003B3A4CA2